MKLELHRSEREDMQLDAGTAGQDFNGLKVVIHQRR